MSATGTIVSGVAGGSTATVTPPKGKPSTHTGVGRAVVSASEVLTLQHKRLGTWHTVASYAKGAWQSVSLSG
jgi:hypothetical protein